MRIFLQCNLHALIFLPIHVKLLSKAVELITQLYFFEMKMMGVF